MKHLVLEPKFAEIIPYSDDDLFVRINDDFDETEAESDEPDDDEEDFYDYKNYNFSFTSAEDLAMTTEGVLATDVLRDSLYESDAFFLRQYYFRKESLKRDVVTDNTRKHYFDFILPFGTLKKTLLLLKRMFKLPNLFFVSRFYRPFYQWVVFNILYLIFGLYWINEERLKLVLRDYFLKLIISFTFYSFEDVDDLDDDNAFSVDFFDIQQKPLYLRFQEDPYHVKVLIAQSDDFEEEFFDKQFWLDQFLYARIFDIDLTDFNPIIVSQKNRLNLNLYNFSRLDFF